MCLDPVLKGHNPAGIFVPQGLGLDTPDLKKETEMTIRKCNVRLTEVLHSLPTDTFPSTHPSFSVTNV